MGSTLCFSSSVYLDLPSLLPGVGSISCPPTIQASHCPSPPHWGLGVQPERPSFLPYLKDSRGNVCERGRENHRKIKDQLCVCTRVRVCVCACTLILSHVLSHVNLLALENGAPQCHHLTNEEMETQRSVWEVAPPEFKMRTFLSLIS